MTVRPSASDIRDALSKVLDSKQFRASPKRVKFLSYVVEETLAGRAKSIKGYSIGLEVYGRGGDFDPQLDPIIRLEAGRLRRDLEHYYLTAGASDEIVFELPLGTYAPRIQRVEQDTRDLETETAQHDRQPSRTSGRSRRFASWALSPASTFVMGLAVAAIAIAFSGQMPGMIKADREQTKNQTITRSTVYVTAFEPLGTDTETASLARGLTQELTGVLARFPELEVFPLSQAFTQSIVPSPATSQTDRPAYVIHASVRIVDERLRIISGLQDADDGRQLWSEQFDAKFIPERVFEIQHSIATSVARKLAEPYGVLRSSVRRELSELHEPNLESYKCVLLAYEYRTRFDARTHKRARACLERATRSDPDYARASALLAYLYVDEVRLFYDPRPDSLERAVAAAELSVELDASDPVSHQALSVALFTAGQLEPAFEAARRAIELNPDNKEALWQLGFRYWLSGRHVEGNKLAQRAIEESPSAPRWYYWVVAAEHYRRGQYEQARSAAEYMGTPDLVFIEALRAMIYGQLGDREAATQSLEICRELDPQFDQRARQTFATHQIVDEVLDHFEDGLVKAGLRIDHEPG